LDQSYDVLTEHHPKTLSANGEGLKNRLISPLSRVRVHCATGREGKKQGDRLITVNPEQRKTEMSLEAVYNWQSTIREMLGELGYWQSLVLAMYSLGRVMARQSAPSKAAEKLGVMGQAGTVQRRLERFIDTVRIAWQGCCVAWRGWVLGRYTGEQVILLVDETPLGDHLSRMLVGLAYRQGCGPLAGWAYTPDAWPLAQVALIGRWLSWVSAARPAGVVPLLEAERGSGTSPDRVRVLDGLGWP
jgi:hypothetical protein